MIEIHFKHRIDRIDQEVLSRDVLSIGHGLPRLGQLDFISLITEYVSLENGEVLNAYYRWDLGGGEF